MSARTLVPALAALAALIAAAPASADQAVAEIGRESPIAAYDGWQAWSAFDESAWHLRADAARSRRRGEGRADRAREDALGRLARARRERQRRRGLPQLRARGLHVKDLRSSKPSRRLLKSRCLTTPAGQTAIRGSRIAISAVELSHADSHGAGLKISELRLYSSRTSGSKVVDRASFGEESNLLAQPTAASNTIVGTAALAGVTVERYHRTGSSPERFVATGMRAVTDANGTYSIVLPVAGDDPWYTAVAATPGVATWAGRGTVGSVAS